MKILYILDYYPPHIGGVEILFERIAEHMAANGHEVTVLTQRITGSRKQEVRNGVKIIRVTELGRFGFLFSGLGPAIRLAREADLIHASTYAAGILAWMAATATKTKTVLTAHEVWNGNWKRYSDLGPVSRTLHAAIERIYYLFRHDHYITVSESTKNQLESIGITEDVTRIYNAVDYVHFTPAGNKRAAKKIRKRMLPKNKKYLYLTYGRPGTSKGFERLPEIVKQVSKHLPESHFVLIMPQGGATQKKRRRLAEEFSDRDATILPSVPYDELPATILAADCVLIPSRAEGFGFVVAESCAMGVPVVATETTATPEVISGKYTLAEPQGLAQAVIKTLRKTPEKRPLKKFTWKKTLKKYEEVYEQL